MLSLHSIGEQVTIARKARSLTQSEVARRARVSRATLDALENGRIREIGVRKLSRILLTVGLELKIGPFNFQRPTLEDLMKENAEND